MIRAGGDRPKILTEWTDAYDFTAPTVVADGGTPLGQAMDLSLQNIEEQKERYRENAIPVYKTVDFLDQ